MINVKFSEMRFSIPTLMIFILCLFFAPLSAHKNQSEGSIQKMDEQTRIFLDQDNSSDAPKMEDIPIEEGRRIGEQLTVPSTIQLESINDIKISTPGAEIPLRIYVPKGTKLH